jgi:hypothetical protein
MQALRRTRLLKEKLAWVLLLTVAACASGPSAMADAAAPARVEEIVYLSADRGSLAVFSGESARFGPLDLALRNPEWPSLPARYFQKGGTYCVSIGGPAGSREYAIKRPIRKGERYKCQSSSFYVAKCFGDCKSAIIEHKHDLIGDNGFIKSYFYVDSCAGVIGFSQNDSMANGIPLDAEWLRGSVGILAATDYPSCNP